MKELKFKDLKVGVTILDDDYIVYKKLKDHIAQLVLPRGSKVVKPDYNPERKLRSDKAIVLLIIPISWKYNRRCNIRTRYENLNHKSSINLGHGLANYLMYIMGKMVREKDLDLDTSSPCRKGIHFFCTESEARRYEV